MSNPAPLAGVRVLDLSRVLAGPYCSMILADLGADVIKVERPGRGRPDARLGTPFRDGESAYYLCVNRGKRSVTIDLGDPAGVEVAKRLALTADVVIESFLPGGADRLGLGYEALSSVRPQLVYGSIAGYSPESVDAHRPGFDFAIQAEAGGMSITGEPDGPPLKVGVAIADITTGHVRVDRHPRRAARRRAHGPGPPRAGQPLRLAARLAREPRLRLARRRRGAAPARQCPPGDRAVRGLRDAATAT